MSPYQNKTKNRLEKRNKPGNKNPTLEELSAEVKDSFFKDGLYEALLKPPSSENLDKVFTAIENFADKVGRSLSTHQLRNVYGEIKTAKDVMTLKMIRPNLAYVAARQDKVESKKVIALIENLIRDVQTPGQLESFKTFMEALVAYHKYYGK